MHRLFQVRGTAISDPGGWAARWDGGFQWDAQRADTKVRALVMLVPAAPRDLPARKNNPARRKHCSPDNLRLPPPLPLMPHLEIFPFLACTLCVYC
jgi:hypothetical protein